LLIALRVFSWFNAQNVSISPFILPEDDRTEYNKSVTDSFIELIDLFAKKMVNEFHANMIGYELFDFYFDNGNLDRNRHSRYSLSLRFISRYNMNDLWKMNDFCIRYQCQQTTYCFSLIDI
jgi:hypothetical protein